MIPLLPVVAVAKTAGGLIARHWRTIAAVVLVLVVLGFCYVSGRKHERNIWQPRLEALKAAHQAASEQAERQRAADVKSGQDLRDQVRQHYEDRVHAGNAALQSALDELRRARAVRPLAKAESAPAACRDFEASPTQLSEPDAGFLIREAARCDGHVEQLTACQAYAVGLHRICSAPEPK